MKPQLLDGRTLEPLQEGKIRSIYNPGPDFGRDDELIIVTEDHISSYDYRLPDEIPHKGIDLNLITAWIKSQPEILEVGPNDLITIDTAKMPYPFNDEWFRGRTALVRKTEPIAVECIVRGNLTGSGYRYFQRHGTVYGQVVPDDIKEGGMFPTPLFTPSTKASEGEHDENIMLEDLPDVLFKLGLENPEENAIELQRLSLAFFEAARRLLRRRGLLLADTKMEFGWHPELGLVLIDEAFTPDASRLWLLEDYKKGEFRSGVDKDRVRNALKAMGWTGQNPNPPHLSPEVIADTTSVYDFNLEAVTGRSFDGYRAQHFLLEATK